MVDSRGADADGGQAGERDGHDGGTGAIGWLGRTAEQIARTVVGAVDPIGRGATADVVHTEIEGLDVAPLRLRRLVVDAQGVSVSGPPPSLTFDELTVTAEVRESDVNRWAEQVLLPLRLSFEPQRIRARTGVAGVRVSSVDVELELRGRWLRLRPTGVDVLGATIPFLLQPGWPLPLPPLPYGVRLLEVSSLDGLLRLGFGGSGVRLPI